MSDYARKPKRRYCAFCKDKVEYIDYKDVQLLRRFMTDRGKIKPRRVSGTCAQHHVPGAQDPRRTPGVDLDTDGPTPLDDDPAHPHPAAHGEVGAVPAGVQVGHPDVDPLASGDVARHQPRATRPGLVEVCHGRVRVRGWAIDPPLQGEPAEIILRVDGAEVARLHADALRADVWKAYPGYGPNHGFDTVIDVPPGTHQICVDSINGGVVTALRCGSVTVSS